MSFKLYGNGIDDDYPAMQQMLDSGATFVYFPPPLKCYTISKTLCIHSGQQVKFDRQTIICLKEGSNCLMVKNSRPHKDRDISLQGGIWDMNHTNQSPNPFRFPPNDLGNPKYYTSPHNNEELYKVWNKNAEKNNTFLDVYSGMAMQFCGINNFTLKGLTIKNPVTYGMQAAYLTYFTIKDIVFDYTKGSPKLWNMDGIHLEGGCSYGLIKNLKGSTHDDLVALTANDSLHGTIDNITIDGIYCAKKCHSAVRLLSYKHEVKNIHISNIYGNFYTYCIGITKYGGKPSVNGIFDNITVDNVYAGDAKGTEDVCGGDYPFIFIEGGLDIGNLTFRDVFRRQEFSDKPFFSIGEGTQISQLSIINAVQKSCVQPEAQYFVNNGEIDNFVVDGKFQNTKSGTIKKIYREELKYENKS